MRQLNTLLLVRLRFLLRSVKLQLFVSVLSSVFLLFSDEFYEQCQQLRGHQASTRPTEPWKYQLPVYKPRWSVKAHLLHLWGPLLR